MSMNRTAREGFVRPDVYEQGRASYPVEIVDAVGVDASMRVADIGCGTGKFTRLIAHAHTIGVEPLEGMGKRFHELLPDVPLVAAVAEALPLRSDSLDVATFASAFHWLDHARALPELHRVLKPGGKLAIIWNRRDELTGWANDFWRLTEQYRGDTPGYRTSAWRRAIESSGYFSEIDEHWFDYTQRLDVDGMVARVASVSFIETHPDKPKILDDVREFLATHPDTRGQTEFDLPYRSVVYVCHNLADA